MKRYKRNLSDIKSRINVDSETRMLFKKATRQIEQTNTRLIKLERGMDFNKAEYNKKTKRFERKGNIVVIENGKRRIIKTTNYVKYNIGTWATKKLKKRLNDDLHNINYFDEKINRVKNPDINMSKQELRFLIKTTKKFLRSQTSTLKGIKKVEDTTKDTIKNILDGDIEKASKITDEEVETLYDFWNDDDWKDVTAYIDPSDLYILLNKVRAEDWTKERYLNEIYTYIDKESLNKDADLLDKLTRIYNKFK